MLQSAAPALLYAKQCDVPVHMGVEVTQIFDKRFVYSALLFVFCVATSLQLVFTIGHAVFGAC